MSILFLITAENAEGESLDFMVVADHPAHALDLWRDHLIKNVWDLDLEDILEEASYMGMLIPADRAGPMKVATHKRYDEVARIFQVCADFKKTGVLGWNNNLGNGLMELIGYVLP